jgi:hypothetical protein
MSPSHRRFAALPFLILSCLPVACRGSSDGVPSVAARVPDGSGQVPIQMIGTWEIRAAVVIETNRTNPEPPLNGVQFVIGPDGVRTIGGFSTRRADLEAILGFPLEWYINEQDGRRLFYGANYDRRAQGQGRQILGLAGGSLDANTIVVEQFNSEQPNGGAETFVRSRYQLARIGNAWLAPELPTPPTAQDSTVPPAWLPLLGERHGAGHAADR